MKYDPSAIEKKWQDKWENEKLFKVKTDPAMQKYYCLEMFPYPSGKIHMGHVRNYAIGDVISRFKSMKGFNVLHPMGWDAFGLPAENAAIDNNTHPSTWTKSNIDYMRTQLKQLGLSYDWDREFATCDPEYYRWEQLLFTKMFEKGLVYKKKSHLNFCNDCATVLANEQVEDGACWRCGNEVTIRELDGWYFRITDYADELLECTDKMDGWPKKVLTMQQNWIGKSYGAKIAFEVCGLDEKIEVFTTRPDTLFGATFMSVAPEHPIVRTLLTGTEQETGGFTFVDSILREDKRNRTDESKEKKGYFTGRYAVNPLNGRKMPVYIANFVLMDYGTGAVMAVPAHDQRDFEFAKKYDLDIEVVISPKEGLDASEMEEAYTGGGTLVNSGDFTGQNNEEAKKNIVDYLDKNGIGSSTENFRLKDWQISRQRYWGAPIPMIECEKCGTVPVPEKDLPVRLPEDVEFKGKSIWLATLDEFTKTECPKCGGEARREGDTMDTFVESSWYFLRYCSPHNDTAPFSKEDAEYWMPVDQYIGGIEHAILHLLYSRFFTKVLRDLGYHTFDEPFQRLLTQGMVCKETYSCKDHKWLFPEEVEDGKCIKCGNEAVIGRVEKMSKSKKNVIDPNKLIQTYGADTSRLFVLFASPPEKELEWNDNGVEGAYRFLNRVWRLIENRVSLIHTDDFEPDMDNEQVKEIMRAAHETIQKVTDDIDKFHLNTAVAAQMEFVNTLYKIDAELQGEAAEKAFGYALSAQLRMMAPFTPHAAEELWEMAGLEGYVSNADWPAFDEKYIQKDEITIVVQVNGKVRAKLNVPADIDKDDAINTALADANVQKFTEGKEVFKKIYVPGKLVNLVVK